MNKVKEISENTREELKESLKQNGITYSQVAAEAGLKSTRAISYFFSHRNDSRRIKDACIRLLTKQVHSALLSVAENQKRISQLQAAS